MFFVSVPQYFSTEPKKVYESTSLRVNKWGENFGNRGKSVIFAKYYLQSIMTNIRLKLFSLATIIAFSALNGFAYNVVKSEFRSAWVATVWALDWPTTGASAETQMAELDRMLDSLANNNFNAVNFQVRSMCDAMYKSSYEPWSSYLTGTRGKDPGFDPLGYVVNGCHKRGMECHAWVNPYRFSTGANWDTELRQE